MRTTTCDICGKRIENSSEDWILSLDPIVGVKALKYYQDDYSLCIGDVCSDCANSIYHYIKGLKKPLDKSTES